MRRPARRRATRATVIAAAFAAALATMLGAAAPARANGRFPATNSLAFRKGTPGEMAIGSTFGLLFTKDEGAHVFWVCEQAIGYNGTFDPNYAIASDGTLYATTFDGLQVSRDGGCTWALATLESGVPKKWVDAIDLGPSDEVWVATAEGGMPNDVYKSTDGAMTFAPVGLSSTKIWWRSVKVAASNAMRVYVSGYQVTQTADDGGMIAPEVHVMRTDDGGAHWTELPSTAFALASSPLVLVSAVSPSNPDVVFARSVAASPPSGDKLYRSIDAGMTWTLALDTTDAIRNVVFLADGSVLVGTTMGGTFQAPTPTGTFAPLTGQPQMACVGQRGDGAIFSCGANWDPDFFALGRSAATPVGPYTKVFRFVELAGPLSCPTGTVQHDTCELQLWPALKQQFGIPDPVVDAGLPPDAATPAKKPGGCCDAGGGGATTAVVLVLAIVVGGWLIRRGKRGKKKCCQ